MKALFINQLLNALPCNGNSFSQPVKSLIPFATGFDHPVRIAHAGDSRMFVVTRAGFIFIVDEAGSTNPVPFLDIDARVKSNGASRVYLAWRFILSTPTAGTFM